MKKIVSIIFLNIFLYGANFGNLLQDLIKTPAIKNYSSANSNSYEIEAIKQAMQKGVDYAIQSLSKHNSFLSNPNIKIPLPPSLQNVANSIKKYGGKKYVDAFTAAINHSAEKAVPQTYAIFKNSIENMSIDDARKLLKGGDGSITRYFKDKNSKLLYEKIYPIVKSSIRDINVMQYYNNFKGYYEKYMPKINIDKSYSSLLSNVLDIAKQTGIKKYLINLSEDALDDYVTKKSIDGIFYMISQEESKIRKNPLAYSSEIIKKVFSSYTQK